MKKKVLKFLQHFGKFIKSLVYFFVALSCATGIICKMMRKINRYFFMFAVWTLRLLYNSLVLLFLSFEKETQNSFKL